MKKILLVIIIFLSVNCFGQNPDPNLFQTWHLSFLQLSDDDTPYSIPGIDPQITPTLTISQNLQISGNAACNSFTGVLNISDSNFLQSMPFSTSIQNCVTQEHNFFESSYFQFLQLGGWYQILPVEGGLLLSIDTPVFGQADFYNFTLDSKTFTSDKVQLYPNPCSSKISLSSKSAINKVEIYNFLGQNCKSVYNNFETIDVSELKSGVYVIKIYDENGMISKKIIKE